MTAVTKPARPAPSASVRQVEIDAGHEGQRLDNFLMTALKGVPKTHIYRIVRKGEVRINKGRVKPDYRLKSGDIVRIPPLRTAGAEARARLSAPQAGAGFDWLNDRILYEDEALIAVDKPSGLAVHGGSGVSLGLIEALRALRPHARFLELVHRLDRDTSGCLLIAKKRVALVGLHAQLRDGKFDKRYLALIKGPWRGPAQRVEATLMKKQLSSGERRVHVAAEGGEGKESASRFSPRRTFADAALVEIRLLTGRTHQARVHAAHLGRPIAGDDKYGDAGFNRQLRALGLKRLFLHAASLGFAHPVSGEKLWIEAPLPPELAQLLDRLAI
ncbi:MAG: 23S rRNA pseudouridine(955/2504/2580) synthase RluC [Gammaproteobacteria bacterium]|nr:23S rRNA pseudouridine(955/2504/2580) synthase RluC [Gammaproteobacteria bacterium]